MRNPVSFEDINESIHYFNRLRSNYETMGALVYLKHFGNFKDNFFKNEFEYLSSFDPTYSGLKSEYYQALLESSWRNQLEEKWGKQLFTIAELTVKTHSDQIKDDLLEETKLIAQYRSLMNGVQVSFKNEIMGLGLFLLCLRMNDLILKVGIISCRVALFTI